MRIIKLSKDVYGFDNLESCTAYFKHVLPWLKGKFNIIGEGHHISEENINPNDIILFSYRGNIISLARAKNAVVKRGKVTAIKIDLVTHKIFKKPIKLTELERRLTNIGYDKRIARGPGWNKIKGDFEKEAIKFLMEKDWQDFI